jgi:hypothetical protein
MYFIRHLSALGMRAIRLNIKEKRGKMFSSMPDYFSLQPSLRKSAHSSQDVPFGNVHIPYSLPSGFFLISVVPPIFPQLTEAGLAIPAEVGGTVFIAVMVAVGVVTGGTCWVQPAMKIPANMQRPRMIKMLFLVFMIYQKKGLCWMC